MSTPFFFFFFFVFLFFLLLFLLFENTIKTKKKYLAGPPLSIIFSPGLRCAFAALVSNE